MRWDFAGQLSVWLLIVLGAVVGSVKLWQGIVLDEEEAERKAAGYGAGRRESARTPVPVSQHLSPVVPLDDDNETLRAYRVALGYEEGER